MHVYLNRFLIEHQFHTHTHTQLHALDPTECTTFPKEFVAKASDAATALANLGHFTGEKGADADLPAAVRDALNAASEMQKQVGCGWARGGV